jgi:hypothetical protein
VDWGCRDGGGSISVFVIYIVRLVWNSLWDLLKDEFLPQLTEDKWREIANGFQASGSMNLNYKGYFSIVLMAVADADYKFTYVDIRAYGKDCDSSVFQETHFFKLMIKNQLQIPTSCPLNESDSEHFPFVLVGDEAFGLSEHLMRPYAGHNLNAKKRIFNYRLCRARRYVYCLAPSLPGSRPRAVHSSPVYPPLGCLTR